MENVRIEAKKTRAFASCGVVLYGTSCSTTFQTKAYQGNSIYISWQLHGKDYIAGPLHVELPETVNYEEPAIVVIMFDSESNVTARFTY